MRVIILGGDGYLGWPTAMDFAMRGHEVWVVDNYMRRTLAQQTCSESLISTPNLHERADFFHAATGKRIEVVIGDCRDMRMMARLFEQVVPEAVVHYAEQPSAPYSMIGYEQAHLTLTNNLEVTFNTIWAILEHAPDCHIIKLGTMGEYGTPNIDIEEGWIEIEHKGRRDKFLFPRAAGSLYHTTKVLDTDLLWFYTRLYGLRVTDLMQGPVYGLRSRDAGLDDEKLLPHFHYDDIFGTLVNRFIVQAVAGIPLTVYGKGGQQRGYLDLRDTLQCVELAMNSPVERGEMRILNQFTEVFSVNELARRVHEAGKRRGLDVKIQNVENPRVEKEDHYYRPAHSGFAELGLEPHPMTGDVLDDMIEVVSRHSEAIDPGRMLPRVRWNAS